jgi:hypothetical protein
MRACESVQDLGRSEIRDNGGDRSPGSDEEAWNVRNKVQCPRAGHSGVGGQRGTRPGAGKENHRSSEDSEVCPLIHHSPEFFGSTPR